MREERIMSENKKTENKKNYAITTGATALLSVLAVPVTLLAGLLISTKRKK